MHVHLKTHRGPRLAQAQHAWYPPVAPLMGASLHGLRDPGDVAMVPVVDVVLLVIDVLLLLDGGCVLFDAVLFA